MTIVFWGKGTRGVECLRAIYTKGYRPTLVVVHPGEKSDPIQSVGEAARTLGIPVYAPDDPNSETAIEYIKRQNADLFILGGYGKILRSEVLALPQRMCVNLHGGKLPEYRGSSPLNWALIRGATSFTISIIQVDTGVDTGPLLLDRTFPITANDTIRDLHAIANREFPAMLVEVLEKIANNTITPTPQLAMNAGYYPVRFPDNGFIVWDMYTAVQIHNCIRALTDPYPGAFTFFKKKRIKLLASSLPDFHYYGEPGRIYKKSSKGLLVCANDQCLWITKAMYSDDGRDCIMDIQRYDVLTTIRGSILQQYDH